MALACAASVSTLFAVASLFLSIGDDEAEFSLAMSVYWQVLAAVILIAGIVVAARAGRRAPASLTSIGFVALILVAGMWWAHSSYAAALMFAP